MKEVKRLLAAAEDTRLYALYVLAATLGLRRGELLGLRWQDIHFEDATLDVRKTLQRVNGRLLLDDTKTEASDSTIPSQRSPAVPCSPTVTNSARSSPAHKSYGLTRIST